MNEFVVTPWEVKGEIDYQKLIKRFGTQLITDQLAGRLERHGVDHWMLRRRIFYSHRDLVWLLNRYDQKEPFVLYTGRGPSENTHLGHLMPWIFLRHLQDVFGTKVYFQLTDDEKYLFKPGLTMERARWFAHENALDFIALGFDPTKTVIFSDLDYAKSLYNIAVRVAKKVTYSTTKAVFGFAESTNVGRIFFTCMQSAPAFLPSEEEGKNVPCLIPCAIDQDAHWRITRDVAPLLGYYKPATIYCKLLPSLAGPGKMSASIPETSIFTTDKPAAARKKLERGFTGGGVSIAEQKRLGGKPEVCSIYRYYQFLFEPDDKKLNKIYEECRSGEMMCGECKKRLGARLEKFLTEHQRQRARARERLDDFLVMD